VGYRSTAANHADEKLGATLHISEKIKGGLSCQNGGWSNGLRLVRRFPRLAKEVGILAASANIVRIAMVKMTLAKCV